MGSASPESRSRRSDGTFLRNHRRQLLRGTSFTVPTLTLVFCIAFS